MYANVLIANVMTAINMLQTMRAFVAFGVVMGSVIILGVLADNWLLKRKGVSRPKA